MSSSQSKQSYTVTCASTFRDAVDACAKQRGVNAADLARSVTLLLSPDVINLFPDPGEPAREDRETVVLRSGPSVGRPWRRKPRLQVRMAAGYDPVHIRRALGVALAMASGDVALDVNAPGIVPDPRSESVTALEEEVARLRMTVSALGFEPLAGGVKTRDEALHVLGFAPGRRPTKEVIRQQFRMLATIHHPDSEQGNHKRMSQLNEAMDVLRRSTN